MNTTIALFKKEVHTAKCFLLGGILFFWSFPLLEGTGTYLRSGTFNTEMPSGMSWAFGGLFAIITAAGLVCMDMPKGLYEFWLSKPVKLLPYMIIKYGIGLAVTLFVIIVPLLFELSLRRNADSSYSFGRSILCYHTFIILLLYSIAFCAGHLFRNMTETVIISCAAALLIYFVPVLAPGLEPFSFFNIVLDSPAPTVEIVAKIGPNDMPKTSVYSRTNWGYSVWDNRHMYWMPVSAKSLLIIYVFKGFWLFTGTMTMLSAAIFAGAWICLKHHFQIRFGLKSMCWSLGLVALILFSAVAFSIGSNLKCLAKTELPALPKQCILSRCFDQTGGVIFCGPSESDRYEPWIERIREVSLNTYQQESYQLEASFPTYFARGSQKIAWSKQVPDKVYFLGAAAESKQNRDVLYQYTFFVIELDDSTHAAKVLGTMPLGEGNIKKPIAPLELIMLDTQTVYLQMPDEITIIDVSDDTQPRMVTKFMHQNSIGGGTNSLRFPLPSDTILSDQQRQLVIHYACRNIETSTWDDDKYVEAVKDVVRVYKTDSISGTEIHLKKIADRKTLPLEKLMEYYPRSITINKNIIYLLNNNASLTVYSLDETAGTLKKVGHYAASEGRFYDMFLREDGNIALVGASQIHIVQPPAVKGR